jgi:autotransporter-associated beta strand protein
MHFRFGTNYQVVTGNPTIGAGVIGLRTLTQNSTVQPITLNMAANVLRIGQTPSGANPTVGGIFITPQAKSLTLGQTPGEGAGLTVNFIAGGAMPWDELILGNFSVASAQTPTPAELTLNTNIINPANNNFLQIPVRLILSGPGMVTLNGPANSFNGGVYLLNGTVNLNSPTALGATVGPMIPGAGVNLGLVINGGNIGNTSGGTVRIPDGRSQNWGADFTYDSVNPIVFGGGSGGTVTMTEALLANIGFTRKVTVANASMAIGGTIAGSAALVKDGAGDLLLYANSASFFDGGLTIRQGTVAALANGTTFGANGVILGDTTGSGSATIAGGPNSTGYASDISVVAGSTGTKTVRNALDYATLFKGTITVGAPLTIGAIGSGSVNVAGLLAGSGLVTVAAGNDRQNVVDFSTANGTFRGGVQVTSGVLRLGASTSLGDSVASTSVLAGGSVDLNGQTVNEPFALAGLGAKGMGALINNSTAPAVSNGLVQITSDTGVGGSGNLTVNGAISGANSTLALFGVSKLGTGTTTLTGANAYTGITYVHGGSLIADMSLNATVIDPQSKLVLGNATFQLNGTAGAARTQLLNGLHVSEGANSVVINNTGTSTTLDLRGPSFALGFSHGTGTVDFRSANPADLGVTAHILTTQFNEAAGAIGAWATVNGGAALATNSNGEVAGFNGYSEITSQGPAAIGDNSQAHVRVNTGAAASLPLASATTNVFTLTQNSTTATTVNTSAGTLRLGGEAGVYITPGSGALTLGTAANAGILTAGGAAADAAGTIIFNNSSAAALTVNSTIANNGAGTVSITKAGQGAMTLNGTNTFTGNTNLQQGQLNLGHASALGSSGNLIVSGGTIDNTSGAPMTLSGLGLVWGGDFTFAGSQPLTFNSVNRPVFLSDSKGQGTRTITIPNAALTLNEGIEGGMALVKTGAGTLNLSGASSGFQGGLTIAAGTVAALDANASFGTGTLQIGDIANNTDSATLIAGLRAGGYDNKLVTSNHTNGAFTGTLTVKSIAGSTLQLNGGVHLNDDLTMTTQGVGGMSVNGGITGNGNLFLNAGSALGNVIQLNGDNTYYLGKLEIDGGTVKLGSDSALGTNYLGTTILNGAALEANGIWITDSIVAAGTGINGKGTLLNNSSTPITVGGGLQILTTGTVGGRVVGETSVGGSGNITFTTPISTGSGFLTFAKQGAGTVTLLAGTNSSYLGQTLVRRGTLIEDLTNVGTGPAVNGTISTLSQLGLDGGTFQLSGQISQPNNNSTRIQTFVGNGTLPISGVTYGAYLTGGSNSVVVDQPASGGGGTNTPPILRLALGNIGRSGGTVNFSMLRGDTTTFAKGVTSGTTAATNQISFTNLLDASGIVGPWATMTSPTNGIVFASKDANQFLFEYAGYTDIAPGAAIASDTKTNVRIGTAGSGIVTLSAAVTDVNTLTQRLTLPQTIDTAGQQLRVGVVGGILQVNTATQQGGGLTIGTALDSGTVTAGGATLNAAGELVISNFSTTAGITVNSRIVDNGSGAVKVTKGAAGIVTLAGTNNYSGGTFVEAGTLLVTGSIQGSATVHTDATIGGTGSISGPVTLNLAANLSPGTTGAGTLTTGSLSLPDSAQFKFDLGGKLAGQFDSVNVNGTVTLGTLNAGPSLVASFINGFNAVPGDSFMLINNNGTSDPIIGTFASGNTYAVGNYVFDVNYAGGDGNDLVLTVAVPEPGSAALLLGAAAPLLGLRRFRRRNAA